MMTSKAQADIRRKLKIINYGKENGNVSKKNKWLFDWKFEHKQPEREVYKLTISGNPTVIQGLLSIEVKTDYVYMHLVENAPFNKGKTKIYSGIAGNFVAFACRLSFQRGHEDNVSFLSKSQLIDHYEKTLGQSILADEL